MNLHKKLSFALRGENFLEFRREQLINQIKKVREKYQKEMENTLNLYKQSLINLNKTYKEMGKRDFILISNMSKIQYNPSVNIKYFRNTGIITPKITFKLNREGRLPAYSFENSSHFLDELMVTLEDFFNKLVQLAEREDIILKLTFNFKKVNRRINGLKNVIIPYLQLDIKKIKEKLEENDRENFVRLKTTKNLITKKIVQKTEL